MDEGDTLNGILKGMVGWRRYDTPKRLLTLNGILKEMDGWMGAIRYSETSVDFKRNIQGDGWMDGGDTILRNVC
jgi:hypothetical protein